MKRIAFSNAAVGDRRAILHFSRERFGAHQTRRLLEQFRATFARIALLPGLGRHRPELDPEGHEFRYLLVAKTFVVVYETTEAGICVARILHGTRNLTRELSREPGNPEG